jgi:hypothetical protein
MRLKINSLGKVDDVSKVVDSAGDLAEDESKIISYMDDVVEGASNSVDSFISKNVNTNFQQAVKEAFTSD